MKIQPIFLLILISIVMIDGFIQGVVLVRLDDIKQELQILEGSVVHD